jgi:hypothetical protein
MSKTHCNAVLLFLPRSSKWCDFQALLPKPCMHYSSLSYVTHVPPIWPSLIWPPQYYRARSSRDFVTSPVSCYFLPFSHHITSSAPSTVRSSVWGTPFYTVISWSVRPYITHIARRASSQMMYLWTYSKRTNLELASPQKRCEFQRCHWLHMTGVVESPYYALHTSVSRNVAGLPGTRYLHSSGPAKQLRASRTYCQRCPETGLLIAELAFPHPCWLNEMRGAVKCTSRTLLAVTRDGDNKGRCFGETCCLHLQSHSSTL